MAKVLPASDQTIDVRAWMRAAESGDADAIKALLAAGADINVATENGETALMRAAAKGYADVVSLLLDEGADVNAKRGDGFTALIVAVFFGHEDVVRELLSRNADTAAQTRLGTTAEKWAASRGFADISELLRTAAAERVRHAEATRREIVSDELAATDKSVGRDESFPFKEFSSVAAGGGEGISAAESEVKSVNPVAPSTPDVVFNTHDVAFNTHHTMPTVKPLAPPPSFATRAGSSLASWPVTMVALPLLLASGIVGYVVWERARPHVNNSLAAPQVSIQPGAPAMTAQPVVPQPLPPATNVEVQPTLSGVPQDIQGTLPPYGASVPQSDGVYPVGQPSIVTTNSIPVAADKLPPVPTVLSENGGRLSASGQQTERDGPAASREQPASTDSEKGAERRAAVSQQNNPPPRTSKQDAVSAPPTRLGSDAPASAPPPQPTPKRKVIQWP